MPLVSIVIANYNCGRFLAEAIESVLTQSCPDYELIICDGGSTDNSLDVIKRYADRLAWWCSEPDKGQSDAFNKGFAHATGKYLTWLNADDLLLPGALAAVARKARKTDADWLTADFVRFDAKTHEITEAKWGPHYLPSFMQGNGWPIAVYGPTTFWKRSVYERMGPIREDFHYSMDTEYWTRFYVNGVKQTRVNAACWAFRMHEQSKTAEFGDHTCSQETKIRQEEEGNLQNSLNGYRRSPLKLFLTRAWRIVDLSAFMTLFRHCFLVGKRLEDLYGITP